MSSPSLMGGCALVAFAATRDAARAKAFYRDVLGLRLVDEDGFALTFDAAGTTLRVSIVEQLVPAGYTVLGWQVPDIARAVKTLAARGVVFQRYSFFEQDPLGVWTAPGGARVAWFEDPDGNTLSVTERAA